MEHDVGQPSVLLTQRYGAQIGLPDPLIIVQDPSLEAPSAAAQASHAPAHAVLQQTPCTQLPVVH